ncbi:MAG: hypothetical protein AVDCRST_MAG20-2219, partial [uncultured Acidimicrobiales bacterium]
GLTVPAGVRRAQQVPACSTRRGSPAVGTDALPPYHGDARPPTSRGDLPVDVRIGV